MAGWTSGWVAAAGNNTSTPFNHTLNSTDVTWQIYVAEDDQGSNAITMDVQFDYLQSTIDTFGAMLSNITKTSFNLQLGAGYINSMFNHAGISFAGKYVKVVAIAAISDPVPGTGDLCKILSEDSGYQMFRNGLTIQWTSSPAFITESSQVVNFPIPFASKPFKVVASTRFPSAAFNTHETMQTTSWNATSVTIFAQSITANFNPVYADIIAIGIAEVTDCPGNSGDPQGTKISNLPSATNLKDDDLFVISKENDNDEAYDASLSVTMEKLSNDIKSRMGPMLEISSIISWTKGEGSRHFMGGAGFEGSLVPAGTWALLYFPWTAYDGGGEDDNAWYHQKPIIMEASKGFDIRAWMASLGSASHYSGSNYTGHGIGFKISEYPA